MNALYTGHIKDRLWMAYYQVEEAASAEWKGRIVTTLKSGWEKIVLFFQAIKNACVNTVTKGYELIKFKVASIREYPTNLKNFFQNIGERFSQSVTKTKEWLGRGWTSLKTGEFLQNKGVAVVSLIAVTLLLFEIGYHLAEEVHNFIQFQVDFDEDDMPAAAAVVTFGGCMVGGVTLFSKITHSPLSPLAIAGLTLTTCAGRVLYGECVR